jgi:pimeloyl-ACP methyl ester carboxylesterase
MTSPELVAWQDGSHRIVVPNTDYQIFVKDLGDRAASSQRTLLLLHGFPESSFSYHKVVSGLCEQFDRVVLFDMLGYGLSDKPDHGYSYSLIEQADVALHVWRALGIEGGHVISHDMGTSVLTELVSRQIGEMLPQWFPAGFHSYTFTNGSMVLKFAKLRVMQKLLLSRFGATISRATNVKTFRSAVLSAHGVEDSSAHALGKQDVQHLWENVTFQNGDRKGHLTIRYLTDRRRFEESRWLPALSATGKQTPVHFCWGDADQVARIEMAHHLKDSICPQAKLSVMPGVGHFCQLGSPDLWLQQVRTFYNETLKH